LILYIDPTPHIFGSTRRIDPVNFFSGVIFERSTDKHDYGTTLQAVDSQA